MGWLLLASIYFVPGVAKLATGGKQWVFSDNLRNRAWLEWHGRAREPGPQLRRLVDSRAVMQSAALVTIVFEIGFVFALPSRRGRRTLTALSWLFHGGIWLVLELDFFMSLAFLHAGLHDWPARRPPRGVPTAQRQPSMVPVVLVGAIIAANHAMPLAGQHYGWPFTIYPIFHGVAGQTATTLRAEIRRPGEPSLELDVRATFRQRGLSPGMSAFLESAVLKALDAEDRARFDALWRMMSAGASLRVGDEAVFCVDVIDVDPARRESPVLESRELARRTV
jgi:hypothetical protein